MACKIYIYILCIFICIKHASWLKESTQYTHTHTHTHIVTLHLLYKPHTHNNVPKLRVWLLLIQKYQDKHFQKNFQWNSAAQYFDSWEMIAYLHYFCFLLVDSALFFLIYFILRKMTKKLNFIIGGGLWVTALKCEA